MKYFYVTILALGLSACGGGESNSVKQPIELPLPEQPMEPTPEIPPTVEPTPDPEPPVELPTPEPEISNNWGEANWGEIVLQTK